MKRRSMKSLVILAAALVMIFASVTVSAKTTYKWGSKTKTYKKAFYNMYYGEKLVTSKKYPALLINDNIMIPYERALVKKGPKVKASWKESSQRIKLKRENQVVKLYVGKKKIYVNGVKDKLYTPPLYARVNGKELLYVPAKAVCPALGLDYTYVKAEKTIYVNEHVDEPADKQVVTNAPGNSSLTAKSFVDMSTSEFIKVMGPIAQADYQKTGILASVTLAQAINESGWGKTGLAQKANNIFGMKVSLSGNTWEGSSWDGKSYVSINTTEEENGKKYTITAKFRKYPNVLMSVADHSAYLCNAKNGSSRRYEGITKTTSYKKQLSILQKGGYCTWSSYVDELTSIIKKYNLTKYDVK